MPTRIFCWYPTVKLYDNMQVDDIIMKRQWRNLSTYRFNELVGAAEYCALIAEKDGGVHRLYLFGPGI